jgi:hypothetical protein
LGKNVAIPNKVVSYDNGLKDLRKLLNEIGFPGNEFGEHSGRRGGATKACESGASLEEIQFLGNWKSSKQASKYIERSVQKRIRLGNLLN